MTLVKFNPKKNNALIPGFNAVFNSVFDDTFFNDGLIARVPSANVGETKDRFYNELAAPGLQKEDFRLNLDGNVLNISAERGEQESKDKNYDRLEFCYNSFIRSFTLPESADQDQIAASYANGLLRVDIPKKDEGKSVARQIEIK